MTGTEVSPLHFEKLKWDSDFFGFGVGKFSGDLTASGAVFSIMSQQNCTLAYYASTRKIHFLEYADLEIKLVDEKTVYKKKINPDKEFHPAISEYKNINAEPSLIKLAIQSGLYSRFKVDKYIGQKHFEALYTRWIENSVKKKIASAVLICRKAEELAGFITLGDKNNMGDIGLIAVDEKFRNQGIAKALINSAENWFSNHNYRELRVVTQGQNLAACALYESLGFQVESKEYFYHLWIKK